LLVCTTPATGEMHVWHPTEPEQIQKLWSVMEGAGSGMLVMEDRGHLRERPVVASQSEFDGTPLLSGSLVQLIATVVDVHPAGITFSASAR